MLAVGNIGGIGRLGLAAAISRKLWTPDPLNKALWLDAADASTITQSGGLVSVWADKSGSGRNATQVNGASQPTINTETVNGLPAMNFSGSKFMGIELFDSSRTVVLLSSGGDVINPMLSGAKLNLDFAPAWNANGAGSGYRADSDGTTYANVEPRTVNDYGLLIATHGPSIIQVHSFEDVQIGSLTLNATDTKIDTLGRDYAGTPQFSGGSCLEIITLYAVVDQETIEKIRGYLAHKWGLTSLLPADHPFKNLPPLA